MQMAKRTAIWILLPWMSLLAAAPASSQVVKATVKINGMI